MVALAEPINTLSPAWPGVPTPGALLGRRMLFFTVAPADHLLGERQQ